jgi:hypothetical protein
MRFPLSEDLLRRLPRHPDWRYELVDGEAWLSPRPRPVRLRRPTGLAVQGATLGDADVRRIEPRDHSAVIELLLAVWLHEDPYRTTEDPVALRQEIELSLASSALGMVAVDPHGMCASVLVQVSASTEATLTWLTVRRDARDHGLATAVLDGVVQGLSARGIEELTSATSAANIASLRWHLSRGFQMAPDPFREVLRAQRVTPERQLTGDPRVKHLWERDVLYRDGNVPVRLRSRVEDLLGPAGRMLSASKSSYRRKHPDRDALFNACVFAIATADPADEPDAEQVWFGDVDLDLDGDRLQRAADAIGMRLVLTREQPFRFDGLAAGMRSSAADRVRLFEPRQPDNG